MKLRILHIARLGMIALSFAIMVPVPARSQNVDGLFNLLGRVIEQDMRRQEYQRQRRYEENQRALEHKRLRAEEQARKNAEREREIALTKRMQAALSALGFYKAKVDGDRGPGTLAAEAAFSAAFGLQPPSLTDEDVAQVEYYAAIGFRNRDEMNRAAQGGFQSRQELIEAEAGGFASASEMAAAHQAGFQTASSYAAFQRSDFRRPEEFRAAEQGGFTEFEEFAAAKKAGFTQRDEYREFLKLGLPDRAAYETHQRTVAAAKAAGAACTGQNDNPISALDTCLKAIASGERGSGVSAKFDIISETLKTRRAELAAGAPDVKTANTDGSTTGAGRFLQEIALVDDAIKRHHCGADILRSAWKDASASCRPDATGTDVITALKAEADKNIEAEQREAAEEEKAQRVAAEAERDRLALENARARVAALIENLTDFMEAKRTLAKPLDVAKAFVTLKQQQDAADFRPIEQALTRLEELLSAETDFQKFLAEKRLSENVAKTNARATAEAEIRRMESFIEQYVARNLLDDKVAELLALQAVLAEVRNSGQDARIMTGQKEARTVLERLELSDSLSAFVITGPEELPGDVQQASNGLAVTEENRLLLEGDPKDILILGNFGPKAPHLVLNLLGKPTFDGGEVDYCWQGGISSIADAEIRVVQALQRVGAEKVNAAPDCGSDATLISDVVVFERGRFLQSDVAQASRLVEAFEKQDLKLLDQIAWAEVGEEAQRNAQTSEAIGKEILAGLREGYGFVHVDNGAAGACAAVREEALPLHQRLFTVNDAVLAKYLPNGAPIVTMSLERAFVGVQKHDCGLVYAEAADLQKLLQAMENARVPYSMLPVWIDMEAIAAEQATLSQEQATAQKQIATKQQEIQGQQALAAKQAAEAETKRAKVQVEMRSRYSQEAKAALNRLSNMSKQYIQSKASDGEFADLFPDIAQWKRERLAGGWEVEGHEEALVDYGTAEWQGRRAEVVFAQIIAKMKNASLGKYAQDCFVAGFLIDDEFDRLRDPVIAPCVATQEQLAPWQASRAFESRWIAK